MQKTGLWLGVVAAVLASGMGAAQALDLPPGPNRDLVVRECQACHSLDMVAASNETREVWNTLLDFDDQLRIAREPARPRWRFRLPFDRASASSRPCSCLGEGGAGWLRLCSPLPTR